MLLILKNSALWNLSKINLKVWKRSIYPVSDLQMGMLKCNLKIIFLTMQEYNVNLETFQI